MGSTTLSLGVPSGGPYRIRVIAFTSGGTFPAVLRSGKAAGISVASGATANASITLADVSGAIDPSTPTSANAGTQVTIKINITDPGDFLAGVSSGRLWSSTNPLTQNTTGAQTSGTLSSLGNSLYEFATAINLPTSGGTFYYQFGEASFAFDNPNGTEAPFLDWLNLQTGAQALQITESSITGLNVSVGNIPASATRLVAAVDGGTISGALWSSKEVSSGVGSTTLSLGVPSGGPYRIRVIAFTSGGTFPAVLRSGKATGISVASGATANASITLADVSGAIDPSTPTSANAGTQVTIKINITDPGDFLVGVSSARLWSSTNPLTQNTTGAQTSGTLSSLGNSLYEFATAINLPTNGGTFYYQFGEASFAFDNPNGTEAPFLDWPNLQTGAQALRIIIAEVANHPFDFSGNGRSGALLYDPANGQEYTTLSNANGTYSYVPNLFTSAFDTLRTGDFNGDGKADLIVYNSHNALAYIGMGNGDGTFTFQSLFWSPSYDIVETGDINGDDKTDVALYNSATGTLYTGLSNGSGSFTYLYHLVTSGFTFMRLADFTGDGKADLLLYNSNNGLAYLGVGDGTGAFTFYPLSMSPGYALADIGDLNGDGKADLILYNPANGNAATGISDGVGGFTFAPLLFSSGFTSVRLADYTGDGKADITVYNKNTAAAYFGTGNGAGNFTFQSLFWSPGYDTVVAEDVNGDGKTDIVLYNSTTGTEYTGISNGNGTFSYTYSLWGPGKVLAR